MEPSDKRDQKMFTGGNDIENLFLLTLYTWLGCHCYKKYKPLI